MKKLLSALILCLLLPLSAEGRWGSDRWNEGGNDVRSDSPFGTDNILIKTDGTGRKTQATGISVDDSGVITTTNDFDVQTAGTIKFRPNGQTTSYVIYDYEENLIGSNDYLTLSTAGDFLLNKVSLAFYDGAGTAPHIICYTESLDQFAFQMLEDDVSYGTVARLSSTQSMIMTLGDYDDYFSFSTVSGVPTIETVGSCDLALTPTADLVLNPTGKINAGGATALEIPNGTDPNVAVAGEIGNDTDGGNETGDVSLRGFDGTNQFVYSQKIITINVTLLEPDLVDAADLIPFWHNTSGFTFTIVEWKAWSDDDDVSLEIEELTDQTDFTAIQTVDAVEISTNGTGVYYANDTTITHGAIEHDHTLAIDFDANDTPDYVLLTIKGWYNGDVD